MISLLLAAALTGQVAEERICTPVNLYGERPLQRQCRVVKAKAKVHQEKVAAKPAPKKTKAPNAFDFS